jgi:hypothetical protein
MKKLIRIINKKNVIFICLLPLLIAGQTTRTLKKTELTTCYVLAIGDYIKAVNKEIKISFDTLYFGKHDQLPNLKFPDKIERTNIKFLSPVDGQKLQRERKSTFYINLIGWGTIENYEFKFVTFTNGSAHQFDWLANYKYDVKQNVFKMDTSQFEYYLFKK